MPSGERNGAEALVLASDPDHILWTDDLIQAHIAAQEYGVRRVWTGLANAFSRFDRPDRIANPALGRGDRTESQFFNTEAFVPVLTARYGTAPRMMLRNPGLWNFDNTFSKKFYARENIFAELRADSYNLLNHANWTTLDTTLRRHYQSQHRAPGHAGEPLRTRYRLRKLAGNAVGFEVRILSLP